MANWASTIYIIKGHNNDLRNLYKVINDFRNGVRKPVEEGASSRWEGNIAKALGATDEQMDGYYLRGFIETCELENGELYIEAEEAWGSTDFYKILPQLIPGISVYFSSEEPGSAVYETNDVDGTYFEDRFCLETYIDDCHSVDYFSDEDEVKKCVAELIEKENVTMDDVEQWNKEHEDTEEFIHVHEFDIVY